MAYIDDFGCKYSDDKTLFLHCPENYKGHYTIREGVTSIGKWAFSGCSGLTSVTIPTSVTSIGESAFVGTGWLENQPDGVIYINQSLYTYKGEMPANTSIVVREGTTQICGSAFYGCSGLTSITIPNSVTSIGDETFYGCSGLTSVTIPNSVKSIGEDAFCGCSGLTAMVVASDNPKYDSRDNCNAIIETAINTLIAGCQSTIIPNTVTRIGNWAFSDCSGLTSITIPNSVTSIGSGAFSDSSGLTSITISNSVMSIGEWAFWGCSGLTSITIPNSVTSIGEWAFSDCSGLASVTIPTSVTSIGKKVFSGCRGLTSMVVESGNLKYDSRDNSNAIIETATNTLIAGCQSTIIPHSVTSIGSSAFSSCHGLTSITIPNFVTSIGDSAFEDCCGLTSITIPNSVTSIGSSAFNCSGLISVVWNAKNCADFEASKYAPFYDIAAQIIFFTFGDEVEHIPANLCNKMANLTSITIPNSVKSIGEYVFGGCSGLTKTNYMGDIQGWCGIKFGNVYSNPLFYSNKLYTNDEVKDLVIPDGITSIGAWSFENCSGLTSLTLPSSVTSIGEKAFEECNALETIFVPAGQKARFVAMGLPAAKIVERDNEKLKQLLTLAQVYEAGVIEPKDMAKAVRYYEGAIEEGSAEAAYHLGELYCNGNEVAADLQLAVNYFGKAAEKHYKDAAQQLTACREALERYNRQMEQFMHTERPQNEPYYLFFDTETNGLPSNYQAPISATDNWPRLIQIGWIVTDAEGNELQVGNYLVYPDGFTIPSDVERLTGISYSRARSEGKDLKQVLTAFMQQFNAVKHIVGHNIDFDLHIVGAELYRTSLPTNTILSKPYTCTMRSTIDFCKLPPFTYGSWKLPKLQELYQKLFGTQFAQAHDAMNDIRATKQCFFELQKRGII